MLGQRAFRDNEEIKPTAEYGKQKPFDMRGLTANPGADAERKRQAAWLGIAEAIRKKLKDEKILEVLKSQGLHGGFGYDPAMDGVSQLIMKSGEAADYVFQNIHKVLK